jgi:uncharacterized protein (DUF362 family)
MTPNDDRVVLAEALPNYPSNPPYHPNVVYPEYPFRLVPGAISDTPNPSYAAVRELLRALEFDAAHYGTAAWNPLGELAKPGQTVLLKPNWVTHRVHGIAEGVEQILDCLVSHTAVLRALADYAMIAVGPAGTVVIADAPIQGTAFETLLERSMMPFVSEFYARHAQTRFEIRDLRQEGVLTAPDGRILEHHHLPGDPLGYARVDLGRRSALTAIDKTARLYRSLDYDEADTLGAHTNGRHQYLIARSVLAADCVINVPKLKTHIKAGITAALKNLVGINGHKAYLPHYRLGAPAERGDEYPLRNWFLKIKSQYRYRLAHYPPLVREPLRRTGNFLLSLSLANKPANDVGGADPYLVTGGNWHGNDTTWRMVIDLNHILRYADADGTLHPTPCRRVLSVVDGLVGGEGNGPLSPRPRALGYLVGGFNPLTIDAVCAQLIGMDWRKLALLREGAPLLGYTGDLDRVEVHDANGRRCWLAELPSADFVAPRGWQGHVELNKRTTA